MSSLICIHYYYPIVILIINSSFYVSFWPVDLII